MFKLPFPNNKGLQSSRIGNQKHALFMNCSVEEIKLLDFSPCIEIQKLQSSKKYRF